MSTGIIIQARYSSTRLPGKILLPFYKNISILGSVIENCKKACPTVIVATTNRADDDLTVAEAKKYGALIYRGSCEDVLSRYLGAAKEFRLSKIVRITSDCPFIDPKIITSIISILESSKADYVSNVGKRSFPHGMDTEAFTFEALERSDKEENRLEIREHVTLHIRKSDSFTKVDYINETNTPSRPDIRITLDTEEDYTAVLAVKDLLGEKTSWQDIVALYEDKSWLSRINGKIYQKRVFSNIEEETAEAVKLLKLNGMNNMADIVGREKDNACSSIRK